MTEYEGGYTSAGLYKEHSTPKLHSMAEAELGIGIRHMHVTANANATEQQVEEHFAEALHRLKHGAYVPHGEGWWETFKGHVRIWKFRFLTAIGVIKYVRTV